MPFREKVFFLNQSLTKCSSKTFDKSQRVQPQPVYNERERERGRNSEERGVIGGRVSDEREIKREKSGHE